MEKTNKSNYAIKLTDENILELVQNLNAEKNTRKFQKIIKTEKSEDSVSVLYSYKKTNTYLNYAEETLVINDYKISGQHKISLFAQTMTKFFGEQYAEDFLAHAEEYISKNTDSLAKKYEKAIKDVSAYLQSLQSQETV